MKLGRLKLWMIAASCAATLAPTQKAAADLESAERFENESLEEAVHRLTPSGVDDADGDLTPQADESEGNPSERTAYARARPNGRSLDLSALPAFRLPMSRLQRAFEFARDERAYEAKSRVGFKRRATWLFPDDACYARASHVASSVERAGFPRPGKVFAFGRLRQETPWHPRGRVFWWFHTAASYNILGTAYVLDPGVDSTRPLMLQEWIARISSDPNDVLVTFCDTYAYGPRTSSCVGGSERQERSAVAHLKSYLPLEWKRVQTLGYDPVRLLGSEPPWLATPDRIR